jgi:hypothetical protein
MEAPRALDPRDGVMPTILCIEDEPAGGMTLERARHRRAHAAQQARGHAHLGAESGGWPDEAPMANAPGFIPGRAILRSRARRSPEAFERVIAPGRDRS